MFFKCLKGVIGLTAGPEHCDAIYPLDIDKGYWKLQNIEG